MIKTENVTIGGRVFVRTYSTAGMMIRGGDPEGNYAEALDPSDNVRSYTETDIPVVPDPEAELTAEEIAAAIEEAMA